MRFHLTKSSGGTLGVRSSTYNGYQWDEIMSAMSDVFLCGGACGKDVNRSECHLRETARIVLFVYDVLIDISVYAVVDLYYACSFSDRQHVCFSKPSDSGMKQHSSAFIVEGNLSILVAHYLSRCESFHI